MKWWFSSWNLFLFSLSKVCRISSADCFYQWIHSLAEPTTSPAKYSGLHFAHKPSVLLSICFQSFSLCYPPKGSFKKLFQLVSDFISLPPSFCFTLRFCSYESTKDKLSLYLIWTFASRFAGAFSQKFFIPHLTKDTKFQKFGILKKNFFRNFLNVA